MESKFLSSSLKFSFFLLVLVCNLISCLAKLEHKVRCLEDVMLIDLVWEEQDNVTQVYLDQLKNYPDEECHAKVDGAHHARLHLSLTDIHRCGVTRVFNQITGGKMFYHKVVVEEAETVKQFVLVKCSLKPAIKSTNHTLVRRNVLPAGFTEPEDLEVMTTLTGKAPEPMLSVGVRQGSERVTGELNVNPGTPLTMEIYLDSTSAPVYGVLVSYMQVTDTKNQEETIIFNGCSVDPYLFENFNTVNGDFLSAKFRAFKFPDSTYVQFRGTVNVCLDKCSGVECSNGQTGYGRRRRDVRDVSKMSADPNKLFEVSLTTFIKINFVDSKTEELQSKESVFILKDHLAAPVPAPAPTAKPVNTNINVNGVEHENNAINKWEQLKYSVVLEADTNSSHSNSHSIIPSLILFFFIGLKLLA